MTWWKKGKREQETVHSAWLGEGIAKMLDPERTIDIVCEWHEYSLDDPRPFIALGALRVVGFRIASAQESISSRVDAKVIESTHHCLVGSLVENALAKRRYVSGSKEIMPSLLDLAARLLFTFYANAQSKPPLPVPHWFVGKEVCAFFGGAESSPNPEEVMTYVQYLSDSMTSTKKLIDELLENNVSIIL